MSADVAIQQCSPSKQTFTDGNLQESLLWVMIHDACEPIFLTDFPILPLLRHVSRNLLERGTQSRIRPHHEIELCPGVRVCGSFPLEKCSSGKS